MVSWCIPRHQIVDGYNYAGSNAGNGGDMQGGYYDGVNYGGGDMASGNTSYGGTGGPGTPSKVWHLWVE